MIGSLAAFPSIALDEAYRKVGSVFAADTTPKKEDTTSSKQETTLAKKDTKPTK